MIRRPPRSTPLYSSAASDVYKRQVKERLLVELSSEIRNAILARGDFSVALPRRRHAHKKKSTHAGGIRARVYVRTCVDNKSTTTHGRARARRAAPLDSSTQARPTEKSINRQSDGISTESFSPPASSPNFPTLPQPPVWRVSRRNRSNDRASEGTKDPLDRRTRRGRLHPAFA